MHATKSFSHLLAVHVCLLFRFRVHSNLKKTPFFSTKQKKKYLQNVWNKMAQLKFKWLDCYFLAKLIVMIMIVKNSTTIWFHDGFLIIVGMLCEMYLKILLRIQSFGFSIEICFCIEISIHFSGMEPTENVLHFSRFHITRVYHRHFLWH